MKGSHYIFALYHSPFQLSIVSIPIILHDTTIIILMVQVSDHCLPPGGSVIAVNPLGGGGKAMSVCNSLVLPILRKANVNFEVRRTHRAGHAFAIASSDNELLSFDGLLTISGDGMVHEIINGLLRRCNGSYKELHRISTTLPLCVIPAGTMNGVSTSLGARTPHQALLNLIKCKSARFIDAYAATTVSGKSYVDVHAFSCAITADHDELMERTLRWMRFSSLRSAIAPIIVIAKNRAYRARIFVRAAPLNAGDRARYAVNDADKLKRSNPPASLVKHEGDEAQADWRVLEGPILMACILNLKHASHDVVSDIMIVVITGISGSVFTIQ